MQVEFKEDTIRDIAKIASGIAYRATDTKSLEKILGEIDKLEKSKVEVEKFAQYRELFPWFLTAGLACLATEILLSQTLWRRLP